MRRWGIIIGIVALTGCVHYRPQPLDAEKRAEDFNHRSLADEGLRAFIQTNLSAALPDWPRAAWNLETCTLAAFYFHPDLDVARARRWRSPSR